jgi:hypothetical protein
MSLFDNKDWLDMDFYERLAIKEASEESFLNFTRIWFELLQGEEMLVNWHHRYAANEVDKVVRGGNSSQSLAISFPPGGTKSEFFSVHLPAYTNMLVNIGVLDKFRNMNLSFADSLVKRNSRRTRDIIASNEYQELWLCSFGTNQAEEWQIVDSKGKVKGETTSRAMGGQITGGRAGFYGDKFSGAVSMDDPAKPEDMFSPVKREALNRKLTNTVRSRRGDKSKEHPTPFFLIMQRLHKEDPVGFCLGEKDGRPGMGVQFLHIKVPALITKDFLSTLPPEVAADCWNCIKDSPSRVNGGIEYWSYWPEMEDIDQLMDLWEADPYTFMSQYMQAPISISGGLIETDWFQTFDTLPPNIVGGAIYVDTNSGKIKERNDYTVFTLAFEDSNENLYVPCVKRGKWDPEQLLTEAESLWSEWNNAIPTGIGFKLRYMSVEDKQAGQGLITTLQRKNKIPIKAVQRGTDQNKWARHCNTQPFLKRRKVFIPLLHDEEGNKIDHVQWFNGDYGYTNDWVVPWLAEMESITVGVLADVEDGYDDQYDTLMDAVQDMQISGQSSLAAMLKKRKEMQNR